MSPSIWLTRYSYQPAKLGPSGTGEDQHRQYNPRPDAFASHETLLPPRVDRVGFLPEETCLGDVAGLVCLDARDRARWDFDDARRRCAQAALALRGARKKLEPLVEQAAVQQNFSRLEAFFREEEVALRLYQEAVARLAQAKGRFFALSAALAYERGLLLAGPLPRQKWH